MASVINTVRNGDILTYNNAVISFERQGTFILILIQGFLFTKM